LLVALAIAAAGCGGDSTSEQEAPAQLGPDLGTPINLASCEDWLKGDAGERLGTIRQIREFAGGPIGTGDLRGATLEDEQAYELFERWCADEFARAFKLYKLYTRAAAFSSQFPGD
jgi:hypothetical protein